MNLELFQRKIEEQIAHSPLIERLVAQVSPTRSVNMRKERLKQFTENCEQEINLLWAAECSDIAQKQIERSKQYDRMRGSRGADNLRYEAAQSTNTRGWHGNLQWPPESSSQKFDRTKMMMAGREMVENDPIVNSILRKREVYVAGHVHYQADTGDDELDKNVNQFLNEDWGDDIDVTGRWNLADMCRMAVREVDTVGQMGFVWVICGDGVLRQLFVEGDCIGHPYLISAENDWMSGIHVDALGRPIEFEIYRRETQSVAYDNPQIIPAENFIHFNTPRRSAQYNGIPLFACGAIQNKLIDIREFDEAMATKIKIGAMIVLIKKTLSGQTTSAKSWLNQGAPGISGGNANNTSGNFLKMNVAQVSTLAPGEDMEQLQTEYPSEQVLNAKENLILTIAGALNHSYAFVRDWAKYNGTATRAIMAQDDREISLQQKNLVFRYLNPTKKRGLMWGAMTGRIKGADWTNPALYKGKFYFPPRLTIDLGKDAQADFLLNFSGQESLKEIAGADGRDWRQLQDQTILEARRLKDGCIKEDLEVGEVIRVSTSVAGRKIPPVAAAIPGDEPPAPAIAPDPAAAPKPAKTLKGKAAKGK